MKHLLLSSALLIGPVQSADANSLLCCYSGKQKSHVIHHLLVQKKQPADELLWPLKLDEFDESNEPEAVTNFKLRINEHFKTYKRDSIFNRSRDTVTMQQSIDPVIEDLTNWMAERYDAREAPFNKTVDENNDTLLTSIRRLNAQKKNKPDEVESGIWGAVIKTITRIAYNSFESRLDNNQDVKQALNILCMGGDNKQIGAAFGTSTSLKKKGQTT